MGITDRFIMPLYSNLVSNFVNKHAKPGNKIAWLGQQQAGKYSGMFDVIKLNIDVEDVDHHFYDIENENTKNSFRWDVHEPWNDIIKDYDMVLALRLAFLIQSSSGLIENLKYAIENNGKILMDFQTGNLSYENGLLVQRWKEGSKNLIPHFPEFYPVDFTYISEDDNLLTIEKLEMKGITLSNQETFKDPIKGRYYTLAEVIKL